MVERKFNGKPYTRVSGIGAVTKKDAVSIATRYRKQYGSARITKSRKGYTVWVIL